MIPQLIAARDAAFAAYQAAKQSKCKKALAESEAALKVASKELTAAKAAQDDDFPTPERMAALQTKALAAQAARVAAQEAEAQQQKDIAAWWRHVEWNSENEYRHGRTPAQGCPGYLKGVLKRLQDAGAVCEQGYFTNAFNGANNEKLKRGCALPAK